MMASPFSQKSSSSHSYFCLPGCIKTSLTCAQSIVVQKILSLKGHNHFTYTSVKTSDKSSLSPQTLPTPLPMLSMQPTLPTLGDDYYCYTAIQPPLFVLSKKGNIHANWSYAHRLITDLLERKACNLIWEVLFRIGQCSIPLLILGRQAIQAVHGQWYFTIDVKINMVERKKVQFQSVLVSYIES